MAWGRPARTTPTVARRRAHRSRVPDGSGAEYPAAIDACSLTFDDGPDPAWTPRLLDCLAAEGARSTFFVIAGRARSNPELVARMLGDGHDVELHCVRHVCHTVLAEAEVRRDTEEGLRTLATLGAGVRRWRPPWGVVSQATARVAADHRLALVGWSADPEDWRGESAAVMHERVAGAIGPGAVVLLHDGIGPGALRTDCRETVALIPRLVETVRRLGLRPLPLSGTGG
jgi:chitooligosaccharide deacetylase